MGPEQISLLGVQERLVLHVRNWSKLKSLAIILAFLGISFGAMVVLYQGFTPGLSKANMMAAASWYKQNTCGLNGEEYVVNPKNPVKVRSRKSRNSEIIGHKAAGTIVCGSPEGHWLALDGGGGYIKFKVGTCPLILPVPENGITDSMELKENFHVVHNFNSWVAGVGNRNSLGIADNSTGYARFMQDFVKNNNIKSITDIGCGHWGLNPFMDWAGIRYVGIEISRTTIDKNINNYAGESITFRTGSATREVPSADLLIIKDVLQHHSNRFIHEFLKENALSGRFQYVLMTYLQASKNIDIGPGMVRGLNLSASPFNLHAVEKVYEFPNTTLNRKPLPRWGRKETFLINATRMGWLSKAMAPNFGCVCVFMFFTVVVLHSSSRI